GFEWPREGALSLKIGRASIFGIAAKQIDVNTRIDANGLEIEQLVIGDFGGAAAAIKGRIETRSDLPVGKLTLNLDASSLEGLIAVMESLRPHPVDQVRRVAGRLPPLTLRVSFKMTPSARNTFASTKLNIGGRAGNFSRFSLRGDANTPSAAFKAEKIAA